MLPGFLSFPSLTSTMQRQFRERESCAFTGLPGEQLRNEARPEPLPYVIEIPKMRERTQILELWRELENSGEPATLATVVRTEGSAYRLPGARLLLGQSGRRAGSVSGGCLEDDLIKKAWWLTAGGPILRKYDTTAGGEIATDGFGMGCNGIIHVLVERLTASNPSVLPLLRAVKASRRPATVAHLLSPSSLVGRRLTVDPDGQVQSNLEDSALGDVLLSEAQGSDGSKQVRIPPDMEVFLERITPPVHLLIFGAGDDAVPLAHLAKYLGWQVSVFDGRAHYARVDKFPAADRVEIRPAGSPAPAIDPWTVAVVMTHSYSQDLDVLRSLAVEPLRYLGVLGPRKRAAQLLAEANLAEGVPAAALHSPMGLDIGADGPEQVALAVLSEIQAVLNGRTGGFLRDRARPIHGGGCQPRRRVGSFGNLRLVW